MISSNPNVKLPAPKLAREIEAFVRSMDMPDEGARSYLNVHVARIVNATGASLDLRRGTDPLVKGLTEQGWITPDPLGLGLVTEADGTVVPRDASLPRRLHALGPLRMGGLWESTAVPELRVQARDLARLLVERLSR